MATIKIFGASDDCICVQGDAISESYLPAGGTQIIELSCGTALSITYTLYGIWRVTQIVDGPSEVTIDKCEFDDGDAADDAGSRYTDEATVTGLFNWYRVGDDHVDVPD